MTVVLPFKDPAERKLLRFGFAGDLVAGETIASVAPIEVSVLTGTDADAATVLDGAPVISVGTHEVLQWVRGGVDGVHYGIRCLATGSAGGVHLASGRLRVRRD